MLKVKRIAIQLLISQFLKLKNQSLKVNLKTKAALLIPPISKEDLLKKLKKMVLIKTIFKFSFH